MFWFQIFLVNFFFTQFTLFFQTELKFSNQGKFFKTVFLINCLKRGFSFFRGEVQKHGLGF